MPNYLLFLFLIVKSDRIVRSDHKMQIGRRWHCLIPSTHPHTFSYIRLGRVILWLFINCCIWYQCLRISRHWSLSWEENLQNWFSNFSQNFLSSFFFLKHFCFKNSVSQKLWTITVSRGSPFSPFSPVRLFSPLSPFSTLSPVSLFSTFKETPLSLNDPTSLDLPKKLLHTVKAAPLQRTK